MSNPILPQPRTHKFQGDVVVGKDILELLSSAMYVNPLTIYREYIQNAADAIDAAERAGLYKSYMPEICITIFPQERKVTIRDNGIGVLQTEFVRTLTAVGCSQKRGTTARGFRGVGRLAGLGYCQELIMRSKAEADAEVMEMRWDCRKLKELLRDSRHTSLQEIISEIVTIGSLPAAKSPRHFFEVELQAVIRYANDNLLNEITIADYLGQNGPVPFSPSFSRGREIQHFLEKHKVGRTYSAQVNGKPVHRLFTDIFQVRKNVESKFTEIQFVEIPELNEGIGAVGWVLHSDYLGAIPDRFGLKGLRARVGNIQIGDSRLLESAFPEARFNSWVVGEFHILSPKLIPNGRRDDFEHNSHYGHFIKELKPKAQDIHRRCRLASARRTTSKQPQIALMNGGLDLRKMREFMMKHSSRKLSSDHRKKLKALLSRPRGGPITYGEMMQVVLNGECKGE